MNAKLKFTVLLLAAVLLTINLSFGARFYTRDASLEVGEKVRSNSSKNGNSTRFIFSNITTHPKTKTKAAFLQWAPLLPRAKDYKNGILVNKDQPAMVWINGVWFTIRFDGKTIHIR